MLQLESTRDRSIKADKKSFSQKLWSIFDPENGVEWNGMVVEAEIQFREVDEKP